MITPYGWFLIGFLDGIPQGVSPLQLGGRALIAVREAERVRIFDGRCPHRGAHLGYGGVLTDNNCVLCPFHGKHIQLGAPDKRLGIAEHQVAVAGAAVFVRIGDGASADRGFSTVLTELSSAAMVVSAVELEVRVPSGYVVENAFDIDHFRAVHKVPQIRGMNCVAGPDGELTIRTEFVTADAPWRAEAARLQGAASRTAEIKRSNSFLARAYSPHLVLTEFDDGNSSSIIVTGGVPLADGRTLARVAVAVPDGDITALAGLVAGARKALGEDLVVWEHLDTDGPERLDSRDNAVLAFRSFCGEFELAAAAMAGARWTDGVA
ncbi:Rieske 2Fe-2S domain-containing protein [Nakamurella aerolata]|uniref:Rieske 2Fe-2S domain-containing protein n=1 Tax=Nakamurella aerolata TaxID=1656892 RepID=A0A849AE07_9ACTN|nr:Rieske 2Fe-2S domain-containing protein [Nakamurella aerolata]NNG37451.1 Rieske 2Fe-2S domain-containing protein [Nakamurella aerolata]